jgi:hypothetical protein
MKTLFYGRDASQMPEGAEFRNARFFSVPEADVHTVYVGAEWPSIAAAYADSGARVNPTESLPELTEGAEEEPPQDPTPVAASRRRRK